MQCEPLRQGYLRHRQIGQAEGAVATLARKMGMQVAHGTGTGLAAMAMLGTKGILLLTASILDHVDEVMGLEEGERAEDAGLVDRMEPGLQVRQRKGDPTVVQRAEHQQAHCRGTDVTQ